MAVTMSPIAKTGALAKPISVTQPATRPAGGLPERTHTAADDEHMSDQVISIKHHELPGALRH
jgi:hypothetical protein